MYSRENLSHTVRDQHKLMSRLRNVKICITLNLLIVLCGYEPWSLIIREELKLLSIRLNV